VLPCPLILLAVSLHQVLPRPSIPAVPWPLQDLTPLRTASVGFSAGHTPIERRKSMALLTEELRAG
jgi:hypothetical protein